MSMMKKYTLDMSMAGLSECIVAMKKIVTTEIYTASQVKGVLANAIHVFVKLSSFLIRSSTN